MQFLARLHLPEIVPEFGREQNLLLFLCSNDPGMCDEWDANAGGNKALLIKVDSNAPMEVPPGPTLLSCEHRFELEAWPSTKEDNVHAFLSETSGRPSVIGKAGGHPSWLQQDETPVCECGTPMQFIAQIDSSADREINFGDGGIGYAFACRVCSGEAKFLWQCL